MSKNKIIDKVKEGVSVHEVEEFARKYATEVFTVIAVIIAAISSMFDFFIGPSLTILFFAIGTIVGVLFPIQVERGLKQLYAFAFKQDKTTQMILGGVQIIVALFIPFLLFGMVGLLAGTAYNYYIRHSQTHQDHKPKRSSHEHTGDEHD